MQRTGGRPKARAADWAYPSFLFVVAALVLWEARRLPPAPFDPLGPKTFPVWIAWGLVGLAAVMLVRLGLGFDAGRARQSMVLGLSGGDAPRRPWIATGLLLLALAYAASIQVRFPGFRVSTALFVFAAIVLLGARSRGRLAAGAIGAIAFALANDLIFRRLFSLDLP